MVYNACVSSAAQSQFSEAELLLTQATERGMPTLGNYEKTIDVDEDAIRPV